MTNLSQKVKNLNALLPDLPPPPLKNLFDITGVTNKEVVNSRVLAYFLDPLEDHGLGSLFFDSFKEVILSCDANFQTDDYTGVFQVILEETTSMVSDFNNNQKRIDILIVGQGWNIIIENKLYHFVSNPLETYWEHTVKKHSINLKTTGIVLSLFQVNEDELKFKYNDNSYSYVNILHSDLLQVIQRNFSLDKTTDLRATFYLKEYINTIESHYRYKIEEPMNNKAAAVLANNNDDLKDILENFNQASIFLDNEVEKVMVELGYTKEKQWYRKKENHKDLWFWFLSGADMIKQNRIWFCLEVWNKSNLFMREEKGNQLTNILRSEFQSSALSFGHDESYKYNYHVAKYNEGNFFDNQIQFSEKLKNILNQQFLGEDMIEEKVNDFLLNNIKIENTKANDSSQT